MSFTLLELKIRIVWLSTVSEEKAIGSEFADRDRV